MPSFNLVTALAVFANDCSNEKQRAELFLVAALLLMMRLWGLFSASLELNRSEFAQSGSVVLQSHLTARRLNLMPG